MLLKVIKFFLHLLFVLAKNKVQLFLPLSRLKFCLRQLFCNFCFVVEKDELYRGRSHAFVLFFTFFCLQHLLS
jgi:hypothetical protein